MRWLWAGLAGLAALAAASPSSATQAGDAQGDLAIVTIAGARCPYGPSNPVAACLSERESLRFVLESGVEFYAAFNATRTSVDPTNLNVLAGDDAVVALDFTGFGASAFVIAQRALNASRMIANMPKHTSSRIFDIKFPGEALNSSGSLEPIWDLIDDLVGRLLMVPHLRLALFVQPAMPAYWLDQVFSSRWLVGVFDVHSTCKVVPVLSLAQVRAATLASDLCGLQVQSVPRVVVQSNWALVVATIGKRDEATVGLTCSPGAGFKIFAWRGAEWLNAQFSDSKLAEMAEELWENVPVALRPSSDCMSLATSSSSDGATLSPTAVAEGTAMRPLPSSPPTSKPTRRAPPTRSPSRAAAVSNPSKDEEYGSGISAPLPPDAVVESPRFPPSLPDGVTRGPSGDGGDQSIPDEAIWAGVGAGLSLCCLCSLWCLYRCLCSSRAKGFRRLDEDNPDVEMRSFAVESTPAPPRAAAAKEPLESVIASTAAYFEPNPAIGAQGFEDLWNNSQVMDVWGHTVQQVPVGGRIAPLMTRLRCVVVASGKVNGVEKLYFFARGRATTRPMMALLEVSVNLSTKRLSCVVKSSVPDGDVVLELLFRAFKRIVEEEL